LLDMKALEKKRNEQDDIAERLRVEETKAKLAKARDGMEKEGQRLKEAKEAKSNPSTTSSNNTSAAAASGGSRFGKASANLFGGASSSSTTEKGKWVPPHLRGGSGLTPRPLNPSSGSSSSGSGFQRKVDTQDENLFPDLATADKIIAQEEEQRAHANRKAKAPTAAWGMKRPGVAAGVKTRTKATTTTTSTVTDNNTSNTATTTTTSTFTDNNTSDTATTTATTKLDTTTTTTTTTSNKETTTPTPTVVKPAPAPVVAAKTTLKKKSKKKKKDLSTFKAS